MVAVLLILDGLGDHENKRYNYSTPLEYAKTPNMDWLADVGATGLFVSVGVGRPPGSAAAMLSILGYDPVRDNPGRGVLDALGEGIYVPGALAARANLATVKDGKVVDRRAGRLRDPELLERIERALNDINVDGADVRFKITLHYRGVLVLKPKKAKASAALCSNDPEDPTYSGSLSVTPRSPEAKETARLLNEWLSKARASLEAIGGPANYVLLRGFGDHVPAVQPFEEMVGARLGVVTGLSYLKGIAKMVGGRVFPVPEGAMEENARGIVDAVRKGGADIFVTHVKAPDVYGHDGDFEGKAKAIERLDEILVGPLLDVLDLEEDVIAITGDHATPVVERRHTGDPVPLLVAGKGVVRDDVRAFGEHACRKGGLGLLRGAELVHMLVDLIGRSKRVGA